MIRDHMTGNGFRKDVAVETTEGTIYVDSWDAQKQPRYFTNMKSKTLLPNPDISYHMYPL